MTAFRAISLSVHGAIEMMLGLATLVAPFVLGFGAPGAIVAVAVGAVLIGAALSTVDARTINVSAHHAFDHTISLAILVAALGLAAFAGDHHATAYLAAVAIVQLGLNLGTRYSAA
jgi:hypothetical protein